MSTNVFLKEQQSQTITDYSPSILFIGIKSSIGNATSGELKNDILKVKGIYLSWGGDLKLFKFK